jgi:hypothetical protein
VKEQPVAGLSKRTQLYLEPRTFRTLELLARRRRASVAKLVREALQRYLEEQDPERLYLEDPIWGLEGLVQGHQSDGAARHDDYLYGEGSKATRPASRKRVRR